MEYRQFPIPGFSYTAGDDFKRAERQRIILQKMIQKLKTAGPVKWNKILDQVLPEISTNMTTPDIMKLGLNIFRYKIGETKGFPFDITTSENVIGLEGSYAVAIGHADNVRQLHEQLFGVWISAFGRSTADQSGCGLSDGCLSGKLCTVAKEEKNVTKNDRRQKNRI